MATNLSWITSQDFWALNPIELNRNDVIRVGDVKWIQTRGGVGPMQWRILDGDDCVGRTFQELFDADLERPCFYRISCKEETSTQNTTT